MSSREEYSKILQRVITNLVHEWQNTNNLLLNENTIMGLLFDKQQEGMKFWTTPNQCLSPECKKDSVKRSHSIQKAGALKLIAENGILLTPRFNDSTNKIVLGNTGIRKASTFPGFCSEHEESLFKKFENNNNIRGDDGFTHQIFRSICRELRRIEYRQFSANAALAKYYGIIEQEILKRLEKELGSEFLTEISTHSKHFRLYITNAYTQHFEKELAFHKRDYEKFFNEFYKPWDDSYNKTSEEYGLTRYSIELPVQVPICLSDRVLVRARKDDFNKTFPAIIFVQPHSTGIYMVFAASKKHEELLEHYKKSIENNSLLALSMIESWMLSGAMHWFINPSIWRRLPQPKQNAICVSILDSANRIQNNLVFSIFDELRAFLIEKLMPKAENQRVMEIILKEQAKLIE